MKESQPWKKIEHTHDKYVIDKETVRYFDAFPNDQCLELTIRHHFFNVQAQSIHYQDK